MKYSSTATQLKTVTLQSKWQWTALAILGTELKVECATFIPFSFWLSGIYANRCLQGIAINKQTFPTHNARFNSARTCFQRNVPFPLYFFRAMFLHEGWWLNRTGWRQIIHCFRFSCRQTMVLVVSKRLAADIEKEKF